MSQTTAPVHGNPAATINAALAQPTLCAAFQVTAAGNADRPGAPPGRRPPRPAR